LRDTWIRLGDINITPDVEALVNADDVQQALRHYQGGNWGDSGFSECLANELSLKNGGFFFATYHDRYGKRFYVDTRRRETTVSTDWEV